MGNTSLFISLLYSSAMLPVVCTETEHFFGCSEESRFINPPEILQSSTQMSSTFVRITLKTDNPDFEEVAPCQYQGHILPVFDLSSRGLDAETAQQMWQRILGCTYLKSRKTTENRKAPICRY